MCGTDTYRNMASQNSLFLSSSFSELPVPITLDNMLIAIKILVLGFSRSVLLGAAVMA